jgi:hypothetical protein
MCAPDSIGRGGGIRTPDPLLPKQELLHRRDTCCKRLKRHIALIISYLRSQNSYRLFAADVMALPTICAYTVPICREARTAPCPIQRFAAFGQD